MGANRSETCSQLAAASSSMLEHLVRQPEEAMALYLLRQG